MSWPAYAEVLATGFRLGQDEDVERTPFDDGMIRQEKRYRAAPGTMQAAALMEADRIEDFRGWARENAHAWFTFPTPHKGDVTVRVRDGAGGITYRLQGERRGRLLWRAEFTVEGPDL